MRKELNCPFEKGTISDKCWEIAYHQGRADERERIINWCKEQSIILKKQSEDFNDEECFGGYRAFEDMIRQLEIVRGEK